MALKPAICTQCGGQIEVDDSKEAGICQFCGTAFITEKVIHQYVTQNNFAGATINIQGGVETDNLIKLARRAFELKNFDEAIKYYTQVKERNPDDWESVFYCAYLKGDITPNDITIVYDLILKNESMFEKADKCKLVFDTVLSGMYTYYWNKKNELIDTIKYLDSKNDALLNSVIGEMIYDYVSRNIDIIRDNNIAHWEAKAYQRQSKTALLTYFAGKEVYKDALEKSIKSFNTNHPGYDIDFYVEFFKAAYFIDKEIANSILQQQLKEYGYNLKKDKYNNYISTIKEIDPSFEPPKRKSTPEKRKAQCIIFGIVSLLIKISLLALPVVLDRKFKTFSENLEDYVRFIIQFGAPFIAVIIPIKKEDSFVSEHKFLTVVLGIIVTCCYSLLY